MSTIYKNKIAEIEVLYHPSIPINERVIVKDSTSTHKLLKSLYNPNTINYREYFLVLYLDRRNGVMGHLLHSIGTDIGTGVSIKQVLGVAVKVNCCSIILSHNHPSGNLKPSTPDVEITRKMKNAAKLLDIHLLDHVIITPREGYFSFADEGII